MKIAFFTSATALTALGLLAGTLTFSTTARAVDRYVDDSFTGTSDGSPTRPYKTVGAGYAAAGVGDTIKIYPGTYNFSGTLNVTKKVFFAGTNDAFSSSFALITGSWDDRSAIDDSNDVGRPIFSLTSAASGTTFTNLRFSGGTGTRYADKKIGTGVLLPTNTNDVKFNRCQMTQFANACVNANSLSGLGMTVTNISNSGYEATTASPKAAGGAIRGNELRDCLFQDMTFFDNLFDTSTNAANLGAGGYGFKLTRGLVRTKFERITFDLKTKTAWSPGNYATSNFGIELTRPNDSVSYSYEDNVITNCTVKNTLSLTGDEGARSSTSKRSFIISNNYMQAKADYVIEGKMAFMTVENNYSKQRNFWSNTGGSMKNSIIRFNICEGISSHFVQTNGGSLDMEIYNNTVIADSSNANFLKLSGSDVENPTDHSAWRRIVRNNVFVKPSGGTGAFTAYSGTPTSDFRGTRLENNYVYNASVNNLPGAVLSANLTGSGGVPATSLFNLTPAQPLNKDTAKQHYYPKSPLWDKGTDVGTGDTTPDIGRVQRSETTPAAAPAPLASPAFSPSGAAS